MEFLEKLSDKLNSLDSFDVKIQEKEQAGDTLIALHKQQRADEKATDKKEAEAEKKQQEFNARASEIITGFNQLQSELNKFEGR